MTHFPELLMNVVTAVPLKQRTEVSAARRRAAASKGFTGISGEGPVVSLSNGQLQICSVGI